MYSKTRLDKEIKKLKRKINYYSKKNNYDSALAVISICARILYTVNQSYSDDFLEDSLLNISNKIFTKNLSDDVYKDNVILFYDGFGLEYRGLAQIYLKALVKIGHVIYITKSSRKDSISGLIKIVEVNGEVAFITESTYLQTINELDSLVKRYKPKNMFMYTVPDDVVVPIVFNKYSGIANRFQINLTDHAFWLGAKFVDYCVEFRSYGVTVSNMYRKIDMNKLVVLPYYPIIDYDKEFQGYPFGYNESKNRLIFSGGSLYKTLGGGNKYYDIVRYILDNHKDIIFWYAGFGDSTEINKLIKQYPGRVYLTEERTDLFQILSRCYFYLSTYPICGGLMFQYAAMAGKVPLTLKHDDITNGFLIGQQNLNIEFTSLDDIYKQIDFLFNNPQTVNEYSKVLKSTVISSQDFEVQLRKLINEQATDFKVETEQINTDDFIKTYLERLTNNDITKCYAQRSFFRSILRVYPVKFVCIYCARKIRKFLGLSR